jgi:hypothetical protein
MINLLVKPVLDQFFDNRGQMSLNRAKFRFSVINSVLELLYLVFVGLKLRLNLNGDSLACLLDLKRLRGKGGLHL